jgi:hypothetical protein
MFTHGYHHGEVIFRLEVGGRFSVHGRRDGFFYAIVHIVSDTVGPTVRDLQGLL